MIQFAGNYIVAKVGNEHQYFYYRPYPVSSYLLYIISEARYCKKQSGKLQIDFILFAATGFCVLVIGFKIDYCFRNILLKA